MTIALTKRQLLALCFHVQPRQLASLEHVRFRRETWRAFGVQDLAADVADLARTTRVSVPAEWLDRKTEVIGELDEHVTKWLRDITNPPYEGPDADFIYDIREKLVEK